MNRQTNRWGNIEANKGIDRQRNRQTYKRKQRNGKRSYIDRKVGIDRKVRGKRARKRDRELDLKRVGGGLDACTDTQRRQYRGKNNVMYVNEIDVTQKG